ncbi:uncharacterized protein LOC135955641 [Calliphora vicina]|uniref:uncharacterized protein LOC135955641 n=1 Tax=Calliphora vicina TaxID=7373 RepID=UPI00325A6080
MANRKKETTESERKIILHMHNQGKSYAEIVEIMERSRFTIWSIVQRFKETSTLESAKHTGRPRFLSERKYSHIIKKVKLCPKISSTQVAAEIKDEFGKEVHAAIARRVLQKTNYSCRIARRKPFISSVNQKKRLEYAV